MGGELIEGGFLRGSPALVYKHGERQIQLDTYTKDSGNSSTTYTRVRAPFINKDELYFKIYREEVFSDIGKFLGMQDIKIGDPFFDEQFIIKSNNRKKLKLFLADPKIKELIQSQPKIHLEIRDDERQFGADYLGSCWHCHGGGDIRLVYASQLPTCFEENWSTGTIASDKWYVLHKKWGKGNNGVVKNNVQAQMQW